MVKYLDSDLELQKLKFRNQLLENPRIATVIATMMNLLFALKNLTVAEPNYRLQAIYFVIGGISLALVLPSYWNAQYNKYVRFGFMLCCLRQISYSYDFPGDRSEASIEHWLIYCQFHQFGCAYGLSFHYFYFDREEKGHTLFGIVFGITTMGSFMSTVKPLPDWEVPQFSVLALMIVFILVFTITLIFIRRNNLQTEFMDGIIAQIAEQRFMRLVMDSHSEGVLIVDSAKNPLYANPKLRALCQVEERKRESNQSPSRRFGIWLSHSRKNEDTGSRGSREAKADSSLSDLVSKRIFLQDSQGSYSFAEFIDDEALATKSTFKLTSADDEEIFFRIQRATAKFKDRNLIIFQVIDVSKSVLYSQTQQQNELLSILNATISHELRNPLNAIIGQNLIQANLFSRLEQQIKSRQFSETQETLARAKEGARIQNCSAKLMTFLVQDFLDYAQIKSCKFRTESKPFSIKEAVEEIIIIQRGKAEGQGITLDTEYLGFPGSDYSIVGDEQRLKQVLLNLQSNALKFTRNGRVLIRVEAFPNSSIKVSVIDTGIGIPYPDQDKLFKLFGFVQSTASHNSNGVGLGLVISEKIITQLGGQIGFSSVPDPEPGHGSTFYFTLPITTQKEDVFENSDREPRKKPSRQEGFLVYNWRPLSSTKKTDDNLVLSYNEICSERSDFTDNHIYVRHPFKRFSFSTNMGGRMASVVDNFSTPSRILVVDDQRFNIEALKGILEFVFKIRLDQVDEAMNGEEAFELVKADAEANGGDSSYSLILMDCNMPFMDGFEATTLIREFFSFMGLGIRRQPAIVALTGHVEPQYTAKCFECGMNQVLSKPVEQAALRSILSELGIIN